MNVAGLTPLDEGVKIKTASSDHLLVDIEARPDLKVGDVLSFRPDYTAMLSASTSEYVTAPERGTLLLRNGKKKRKGKSIPLPLFSCFLRL